MTRQAHRVQCMRHPGGVLVATARMNQNVIVRLLVDTGAAITVIVPRAAARLGLALDKPRRVMTVGTAHTARTAPIPIFELDSLRIGDVEVAHLELGVVDFPPSLRIDGALGVNFLAHFYSTFKFDTATVILRPLQS